MKRKYYLIDTENVGDRWIDYIDNLKEGEILLVFYTKNHSKLLEENYLKQRYNKQIRWIECVAGNNSLDHQLMGVLSYLIATHADAVYSIYSNDKDYKNVIDFWKKRNVCIDRVGFSMDKKKKKKDATDIIQEYKGIDSRDFDVPDIDEMPEQQKLIQIAKAVPISDTGGWYAALTALMGQEAGRDCYARIKKDVKRKEELSGYLLPEVRDRNIYLMMLLYRKNHLDEAKAEEAYQIVGAHKNKDAMKADFYQHFGKKTKEQTHYYKVIKPILTLLKGK